MDSTRDARSRNVVMKAMALDRRRKIALAATAAESPWQFAKLPPPPVRDTVSDLGLKRWGVDEPSRIGYIQPSAERTGVNGWGRADPQPLFRALQPQAVRLSFETDPREMDADSNPLPGRAVRTVGPATVSVGEKIVVLEERRDQLTGTVSLRIDRGWLSMHSADGTVLLQPVQAVVSGPEVPTNFVTVNVADEWGRTPLMWAAIRSQYAEVKQLVTGGVDLDLRDVDGWTALMWAAFAGHASIVEFLLSSGGQHMPQLVSISVLLQFRLTLYRAFPANVHVETAQKWTAFHYACTMGHTASVAALIRGGCEVEQRVKAGRAAASERTWITGKEIAALRGHAETVAVCESVVADSKAAEHGKNNTKKHFVAKLPP
eukprot:SAG31_NODE_97_length_25714_cov_19.477142_18_plen_375_part_00